MTQRPGILVLCTGNSARSQMAEALLRKHLDGEVPVYSAGTEPADRIHPLAIQALEEVGLEVDGQRPKGVGEYMGRLPVHTLITVCGDAEEKCPSVWPGVLERLHWPFPDPAAAEGSEEERLQVFRETRDAIEARIAEWIAEGRVPAA